MAIGVSELKEGVVLVEYDVIPSPDDAAQELSHLALSGPRLVLIEGNCAWLNCMIMSKAHATFAIAIKDEQTRGYVVVESHHHNYKVGDVVYIKVVQA